MLPQGGGATMGILMNRREVLQMGVAAASAPGLGIAQRPQPPKNPLAEGRTPHPEHPSELASTANWVPEVFDPHQNETVIVLTDLILPATDTPGAKAVNANRYIDLILHDGHEIERTRFLEGLNWLDGYARRQYGRTFIHCTQREQTAMLESLESSDDPALVPGNHFFRAIKSLTSSVYYNTKIGYDELNKGGRLPGVIGCKHPEHA